MPNQIDFIARNATSKIIEVLVLNGSGKGVTGLANTAVFIRYFERGKAGASATANPVVNATNDVWLTNGWKEVDSVNLPGVYQYSIPNAILQSNSGKVYISFRFTGAANQDVMYEINLTKVSSELGVKLSTDGVDDVAIEALNMRTALQYMASVLCGETTGAETAQTIFKAINNNAVSRVTSQSSDSKNRTGVTLL
jgi:hypothetical protein